MKQLNLIILSGLLLLMGGCEEVLEYEPNGYFTYDTYYQTEEHAEAAVNAIYEALIFVDLYNSSLWLVQDVASDDCDVNSLLSDPGLHQLDRYTLQSTNDYLTGIWQSTYTGIHRANVAILKIPDIEMDEDKKAVLLGQAHFLRGLFYFNLVRLFGDLPLVETPSSDLDDYYTSRTDAETIYQLIIEDFDYASETLPTNYTGSDIGRATKGAALGLLSKVYLTRKEWNLAAQKAKEVMDLNIYSLWSDFADNFKESNYNGQESIFEVQFTDDASIASRIVISGLPSILAFPAGVEIMLPTDDLLNSFEEGDHRYEITFFEEYDYFGTNTFEPHIWKHWDQTVYTVPISSSTGAHFPVMRYAEVLLIYAEALNEANSGPTTEAYNAMELVRERARNGNLNVLPELEGLNQEQFRQAVWKEKRCETVNEGHRWFDLVRTGRLVEAVTNAKGTKANPQQHNYLFPIPQSEIDINSNLKQNEGY